MRGGVKTVSGKNRIVPIHSKIDSHVRRRAAEGGEYLFMLDGQRCSKRSYYALWGGIMERAGMKHTPHECRHTFRTRLDGTEANRAAVNLLMGHKSQDVGERIYTHKTLQDLKNTIELITR